MTALEYALAVVWLAALTAMPAFGARAVVGRLCPGWSGPPGWLAELCCAIAILVVAAELAGLLGGFTRPGLLVAVCSLSLAAAYTARRISPRGPGPPPSPPQARWLVAVAAAAVLVTAIIWAAPTLQSLDVGMYRQDSTWYHLTFSADFAQSGHVGGVHFTDPMRLTVWFYPQNSELLHGIGMVAFGSDFLSPWLNLGWMLATLFAAWCAGRPFAAGPLAVLAVAIVLGSNMMQSQAGNAPSDVPALFFLVAAIALLLDAQAAIARRFGAGTRFDLAGRAPGALLLAGLAAGLAVGTKITMLPAVATITVALVVLSPAKERLRTAGIWVAAAFATGGFWYLRNAVQAGNPLPWVDLGFLPVPDQIPLYPRPPHSVADYALNADAWADWFIPGLNSMLGPVWPAVIVAFLSGLLLAVRSRGRPLRRVLGFVGIVSALAYAFIPITAPGPDGMPYGFGSNLRYLAPAMVVGLLSLALAFAPDRRGVSGAWTKLVAVGLGLTFIAVASASDSWRLDTVRGSVLLGLVLVLAPTALAVLSLRGRQRSSLAAVAVALFLCLAIAGYAQERTYAQDRYRAVLAPPADNPGFRSSPQWRPLQEWGRQQSDERIGIVGPPGAFGQFVFYGADLSNRVQYVGRPGPRGEFRPIANCFEWRRAVNAGRFTYLVVTPALSLGPMSEPQETLWTQNDPGAELVLNAPPASIFRIVGPLDPRGCATQPQLPILPVPWGGVGAPGVAPRPILPPSPRPPLSR